MTHYHDFWAVKTASEAAPQNREHWTSGWRRVAFLIALMIVASPGSALRGHHSLAGVYDSANRVSIDGLVSEFHFVNPHPFVTVSVKAGGGRSTEWRLELDNRFELEAIGMTSRTLSRGDRIIASGSRGRDNANSLYVRRLDRPSDGFWYEQVGSSPRVRPSQD